MKKSGLKTGMLVMKRSGNIELVVKKTLLTKVGGFNNLASLNDNLKNKNHSEHDIIKVSKVLKGPSLGYYEWKESLIDDNILWKEEAEIFACELDGVTYSQSTLRSLIKKANSI